jgi:predicted ABC-type ATPase
MKQVLVLVGPKGAGKSTIGEILATDLGLHFLRVEPIFLDVRAQLGASDSRLEPAGFQAVLRALRDALGLHDIICFETTGASAHVSWLLEALRQEARVLLIRVLAAPDQCLARIRARDASIHIPVSDDQIDRINAIAHTVALPWTAELDNRGPLDRTFIVSTVRSLLTPRATPAGA